MAIKLSIFIVFTDFRVILNLPSLTLFRPEAVKPQYLEISKNAYIFFRLDFEKISQIERQNNITVVVMATFVVKKQVKDKSMAICDHYRVVWQKSKMVFRTTF